MKTFKHLIFVLIFIVSFLTQINLVFAANSQDPNTQSANQPNENNVLDTNTNEANDPTTKLLVNKNNDLKNEDLPKNHSKESPTTLENTNTDKTKYESADKAFSAGLSLYQNNNYKDALIAFSTANELKPSNPTILTNLGMTYFQTGEIYWSIATLRKSLSLDPDLQTTQQALKFILTKNPLKEIPHEILFLESLRTAFLDKISLNKILFLSVLLFFASSWILISYFAKRKEALKAELLTPNQPWIGIFLVILFSISIFLGSFKLYDSYLVRATIVEEKVPVRSLYGENSASIFDLFGGHEVIIEKTDSDWAQVTYPGALTGWIPLKALLITTGK